MQCLHATGIDVTKYSPDCTGPLWFMMLATNCLTSADKQNKNYYYYILTVQHDRLVVFLQLAFSSELCWCTANCNWIKIKVTFELSSSLINVGAKRGLTCLFDRFMQSLLAILQTDWSNRSYFSFESSRRVSRLLSSAIQVDSNS